MDDRSSGLDGVIEYMYARIAGGSLRSDPFPHLVVDDVLPAGLLRRLVADLPAPDRLVPVAAKGWSSVSRYQNHGTATLDELDDRADPEAWATIQQAMTHFRLEAGLRVVFGQPEGGPELYKEVRLDCGTAGAHLMPHTDAPIQFMKVLIYLSVADSHPSADTVLYYPRDPAKRLASLGDAGDYTDDTYAHESLDDHREVARVPFRINRMFAFLRTRDSLHGLAPLSNVAAPRYLLVTHIRHIRN